MMPVMIRTLLTAAILLTAIATMVRADVLQTADGRIIEDVITFANDLILIQPPIGAAERVRVSFSAVTKKAAECVVSKVRHVQREAVRVARKVASLGRAVLEALPGLVDRAEGRLGSAVLARRRELLQAVDYVWRESGKPMLFQIFDSEEGAIEAMLEVS